MPILRRAATAVLLAVALTVTAAAAPTAAADPAPPAPLPAPPAPALELTATDAPAPGGAQTYGVPIDNQYLVVNCGWGTCTVYFTQRTTRAIAKYGTKVVMGASFIPTWLTGFMASAWRLIDSWADDAVAADPDRCVKLKYLILGHFIGGGTAHIDGPYCKSGT